MSQKALAQAAGVSAPHIVLVESGQRGMTLGTLEKLAKGLGVSARELFAEERVTSNPARGSKILFRLVDRLREESDSRLRAFEKILKAFDQALEAEG